MPLWWLDERGSDGGSDGGELGAKWIDPDIMIKGHKEGSGQRLLKDYKGL